MAVVNLKATPVANRDALPSVKTPGYLDGAFVRHKVGTLEKAASDSNASVYRFFPIRSSAYINSLTLFNDALAGATDVDIGFYRTAADGGAVVSKDALADGISLASASTTGTILTFSKVDIANIERMRVWEILGLTADPMLEYDVAITLNTAGGAAGTMSLRAGTLSGV